jgi:hypothetical protein
MERFFWATIPLVVYFSPFRIDSYIKNCVLFVNDNGERSLDCTDFKKKITRIFSLHFESV